MNTAALWLTNKATSFLPSTKLYPLKAKLYRRCGIEMHHSCRIVSSANIWGTLALTIGHNTFIGHEVLIAGGDCSINIGAQVDIGPRVCIISGTHELDMQNPRSAGKAVSKDISISDGAWIGAGAVVLAGVKIGYKSVIGAGSVVVGSIPPYTVAVGNPCRPVKTWDPRSERWDKI